MSAAVPLARGARVLVTGAAGFIGSHLVARLRGRGHDVVTVSRASGFDLWRDALPLKGVEHVFHVAGVTGVGEAWHTASTFHQVNATGTVRVLEQVACGGCPMTYVGGYVYGVPRQVPIAEDHPVVPNNPYAFSKYQAELACEFFAREFGVAVSAIRLFNVYGPGQRPDFVIGHVARQVAARDVDVIRVQTLEPRRDYLYVEDAVDALIAARCASGCVVLNVGSGASHPVSEIIERAQRIAGTRKPVEASGERRRGEIMDVVADVSRIHAFCGWVPRTPLDAGLERTLEAAR